MKYVDLLNETGLLRCQATATPMEVNHDLCFTKGELLGDITYQAVPMVTRKTHLSYYLQSRYSFMCQYSTLIYAFSMKTSLGSNQLNSGVPKSEPRKGLLYTKNNNKDIAVFTDAN